MHRGNAERLFDRSTVTPYRRCTDCGLPMEGIPVTSTLPRTIGDCCFDDGDLDFDPSE